MDNFVSVIIPAYNVESYLKEAIDSVLAQTFPNWELVIIDDNSTDRTLDIALGYRDGVKVRVVSNNCNQGVANARDRGVAASCHDWVTFLDGDDWWAKDKLLHQVQRVSPSESSRLCYSFTDFVSKSGEFLYHGCHRAVEGSNVFLDLFQHNFIESGSNALIARSLFNEVGGFQKFWQPAEDWQFFLEASKKTSFCCTKTVDIFYRQRPGSASRSGKYKEKLTQIAEMQLQKLDLKEDACADLKARVMAAIREGRLYQK